MEERLVYENKMWSVTIQETAEMATARRQLKQNGET